ncbi:MAG TPA: NYN domain-containing protein [Phototrophicaceae bacterium]|nr:NYN domain-containing protein [Phototrophicaceae bacterium]
MDNLSDNPNLVESRRIAMLIDGDNAQASLIGEMLAEAGKYGLVTIRRVYGDWTTANMGGWKETLQTHAIQPIQQFRYTVGKNATDSAMIIDAMDILYTVNVDGFCLVSSDSDYTRLATRIREKSLFVMGIGKQLTPNAFVKACDIFVYTENLVKPSPNPSPRKTKTKAKLSRDLESLFKRAFDLAVQDDGWAFLGALGHQLHQLDPSFDSRTYGYKQLSLLVNAHSELFEVNQVQGQGVYVRLKRDGE